MTSQSIHIRYMSAMITLAAIPTLHPVYASAIGPKEYQVVDLGLDNDKLSVVAADSINESGYVGGRLIQSNKSYWQPFRWINGEFTILCLSGRIMEVNAINELGVSTGFLDVSGFDTDGLVWFGPDRCELFNVPGGTAGYAINEADTVAFTSLIETNDGVLSKAYIYQDGVSTELLGFGPNMNAGAYAINNNGWVGGSADECVGCLGKPGRPVIWIDGNMEELIVNDPPNQGRVVSINDDGIALGYAFFGDNSNHQLVPFLWDSGNITDLGTQGSNGSVTPEVISNTGEIIGNWHDDDRKIDVPVILIEGEWVDLNTLIDPNNDLLLEFADDINAAGEIVGHGQIDGLRRGFILIPKNEFRTTGPVPGVANELNSIRAFNATPEGRIIFAYAFQRGEFTLQRFCPGLTLNLQTPRVAAVQITDQNGSATLERFVSPDLEDVTIYLQAIDLTACTTSPVLAHHFPKP